MAIYTLSKYQAIEQRTMHNKSFKTAGLPALLGRAKVARRLTLRYVARKILENSHWVIASEFEGNEYDVSGVWQVSRPDGANKMHIEFEGLDDMNTLPVEESYGCRVKEAPNINLHFSRVGRSWSKELTKFINELNDVAT